MFNTLDSQPQEWLLNQPDLLHTISVCSFRDAAHARHWIHELVPRDQNGQLVKWSGGARTARRARDRRLRFAQGIDHRYDEFDFAVHCISSSESEISCFTQAFYLQNLAAITQESDDKNRNCLVFRINSDKTIQVPVLRAARLIWVFYCLKYLKDVCGLTGFIYSDWFAGDTPEGEDPALGVGLVNLFLQETGVEFQLSVARDPGNAEADLLSDWFSGWCNSARSGTIDGDLASSFDRLLERTPSKVDWIRFAANLHIQTAP